MYSGCSTGRTLDIYPDFNKARYARISGFLAEDIMLIHCRIVTLGGAFLFVLFGIIYLREAWLAE